MENPGRATSADFSGVDEFWRLTLRALAQGVEVRLVLILVPCANGEYLVHLASSSSSTAVAL